MERQSEEAVLEAELTLNAAELSRSSLFLVFGNNRERVLRERASEIHAANAAVARAQGKLTATKALRVVAFVILVGGVGCIIGGIIVVSREGIKNLLLEVLQSRKS